MTVTVHETIWGFIDPGSLISDADGVQWRVQAKRTQLPKIALYIDNGRGQALWVVREHDDDVCLVDETSTALDAIRATLGGILVLDVMPNPFVKPGKSDPPSTVALYKSHLQHHHGVYAGHSEKSLKALRELHALEHTAGRPMIVPHIHIPQH